MISPSSRKWLHQSEIRSCAAPQGDSCTVQYTPYPCNYGVNYVSSPTSIPFFAPASSFVAIAPVLFDVSETSFDLCHCFWVTCILTNIVANLDCRTTASTRKLDDNVQWYGLLAIRLMLKIIRKKSAHSK